MKRISILSFVVICLSVSPFAQVKYSTYNNKRFFFSISYPSSLLMIQSPPFNGSGRSFLSKDKKVEMLAWGEYNAAFMSVEERFADELSRHDAANVTFKTLSKNWFVISGVAGEKVFYQKTIFHKFKETEVYYTFTIEYPNTEKKKYDPIVTRIERSFKFDPNADV